MNTIMNIGKTKQICINKIENKTNKNKFIQYTKTKPQTKNMSTTYEQQPEQNTQNTNNNKNKT